MATSNQLLRMASAPTARRGWLSPANLWTAISLTLTALVCGWVASRPAPQTAETPPAVTQTVSGEPTIAPVDERIELAQVGTAVWSHNPSDEEPDLEFGDKVDQSTWKHLVLRTFKEDGSACDINLLRPDWWVEEEAAERGGTIYVSVPECGIDGDAEVLEIRPCPPVQHCPPGYRTITGTFHHQNAKIIDLYIEGLDEPIGTTPNHPFWSVDRQDFVRADELKRDEKLHGAQGLCSVKTIDYRLGRHEVHNLEVNVTHTYCVTDSGVLVHNVLNLGRDCTLAELLRLTNNLIANGRLLGKENHHPVPKMFLEAFDRLGYTTKSGGKFVDLEKRMPLLRMGADQHQEIAHGVFDLLQSNTLARRNGAKRVADFLKRKKKTPKDVLDGLERYYANVLTGDEREAILHLMKLIREELGH